MATSIRVALGGMNVERMNVERSYHIQIDHGNLRQLAVFEQQRRKCAHAVVITDENVAPLHARTAAASLTAAGIRADVVVVPAGEASKSITQAEKLWNELARLKT